MDQEVAVGMEAMPGGNQMEGACASHTTDSLVSGEPPLSFDMRKRNLIHLFGVVLYPTMLKPNSLSWGSLLSFNMYVRNSEPPMCFPFP